MARFMRQCSRTASFWTEDFIKGLPKTCYKCFSLHLFAYPEQEGISGKSILTHQRLDIIRLKGYISSCFCIFHWCETPSKAKGSLIWLEAWSCFCRDARSYYYDQHSPHLYRNEELVPAFLHLSFLPDDFSSLPCCFFFLYFPFLIPKQGLDPQN